MSFRIPYKPRLHFNLCVTSATVCPLPLVCYKFTYFLKCRESKSCMYSLVQILAFMYIPAEKAYIQTTFKILDIACYILHFFLETSTIVHVCITWQSFALKSGQNRIFVKKM